MKFKVLFFFYIVCATTFSQVGGETIFNFLNVPTSARQAALGGKVLTLYDDVNQPIWNPSTINQELDNKISINYVNFLADINYGSVNFAHFFSKRFGTLHGGITFVDYGEFIAADENGIETGTFKSRDLAASIGYARNLPWSDFYVGANFKLINSTIDTYTSSGAAFDFALLYYNYQKPYVITAVVRNLGYQINAFDEIREPLPLAIEIGASYKLENIPLKWHFTIDNLQQWNVSVENPSDAESNIGGNTSNKKITFLNNTFRHFIVGAEFFPDRGFNLRFGYNFRRARELRLTEIRTFSGFTAGFGIKLGKMRFNYAFSKYHPTSNSSTFSLQIDLNSKIR
ncbi:MAG: type IX secretion system protein PorQ [Flavobacteriaceae bacterium]|nr:type IX secretion system protein PorQ [Flavobacteriaceae bacterium]